MLYPVGTQQTRSSLPNAEHEPLFRAVASNAKLRMRQRSHAMQTCHRGVFEIVAIGREGEVESYAVGFCSQTDKKVSRHFEAQPTTSHAWRNLEQVRHNALVESACSFLRENARQSVPY